MWEEMQEDWLKKKKQYLTNKIKKIWLQWDKNTGTRPLVIKKRLCLLTKGMSLSKSTKKNCCVKEPSSTSEKWSSAAESKQPPKKMFLGCFTYTGPGILIPTKGMSKPEAYINYSTELFQLWRRTSKQWLNFSAWCCYLPNIQKREESNWRTENKHTSVAWELH